MKLSELKKAVDHALKFHPNDDLRVMIRTSNGGVPTSFKVDIASVVVGGDWDKGLFIICPDNPLFATKKPSLSASELAEQKLEKIKTAYDRLKQKYLPKSHEDSWKEGFKEGIRSFTLLTEDVDK